MSNILQNSIVTGGTTATPIPPPTTEQKSHVSQQVVDTTRVQQKTDVERIAKAKHDESRIGTHINTTA
jgi:hypothetical protein